MATRSDQAPIDAIRLVLRSCSVTLKSADHQINVLPEESDLEYYFVPVRYMHQFEPYYRPGTPFKNLKLVNYQRPAISLNFFFKHKYTINHNVPVQEAQEILEQRRNELFNRSFLQQVSPDQQLELKHIDGLLLSMCQSPDQYQFAVSNYHHYYKYWYCSFRYFEVDDPSKTSSHNEHLLKHTQRTDERSREQVIHERLNIIFIDPHYITRPVPYDNKLIDRELDTYSDRIKFGKATLYVKSLERNK
jgi:hypothetical protein